MLILDGGLGTTLEQNGHVLTDDKLWSTGLLLTNPQAIMKVHTQFYQAGSDIVTTASYQFSFEEFEKKGISKDDAAKLLRQSIAIAKESQKHCDRENLKVAASLGSYGAVLADGSEFTGIFDKDENQLAAFHKERIEHLLCDPDIQPDYLAFETIPCLMEVATIIKALESVTVTLPKQIWLSLSCSGEDTLNSGEAIRDAITMIDNTPIFSLIGFNCLSPFHLAKIIEKVTKLTSKPLVLYPNRGEVFENREWNVSSGAKDDELLEILKQIHQTHIASGQLHIIGGCCRVGPQLIKKMSKQFN